MPVKGHIEAEFPNETRKVQETRKRLLDFFMSIKTVQP